jgi:hypothetical protein
MIFTFLCVALHKCAQLRADKVETSKHFIVDGTQRTDHSYKLLCGRFTYNDTSAYYVCLLFYLFVVKLYIIKKANVLRLLESDF